MTSSVGGLRSSKELSKVKLAPKWDHGHLFGGLLLVWFTTAFWIPKKPLHLSRMLSKLMRSTKNCNDYSQHWLTEWVQFFSRTMADCRSHNQCFKSWMNWAMKFCFIHHIHLTSCQPTTTSSNILTTFCRENASSTNRRQKMLFKSSLNPETQIFTLQEQTNLFLVGKNVLIVMISILINKNVFEPSYNDLKITVWNCNYFCPNLIKR